MRGGSPLIKRARSLRADMTNAERLLWQELRRYRLGWRFRRQFPIPPYVVDFACIEARLIIEADGGQHAWPGDHERRDRLLSRQGWSILRFWNNDILANRPGVLQTIAAALERPARQAPPPRPSPACGGGGVRQASSPPPRAGEG
jgi:very-short-patch-repair endonuclease